MEKKQERRRLAVLEPIGDVFVNGLASSYEEEFPDYADCSVAAHMTQEEFHKAITKINDALQDHWPCMPCTSFAYGCCICTLGLSFYCASSQVREAEERVQLQIRRINEQENCKSRQIQWKLVCVWYKRSSFIEISVASDAPLPLLPPSTTGDATIESGGHLVSHRTGERHTTQSSALANETMDDRVVAV